MSRFDRLMIEFARQALGIEDRLLGLLCKFI
jgi:hypothetical protein